MISNTELFYTMARRFQDERAELNGKYEKNLQALKRFEGSKGFSEDLKKLNEKHEGDLKKLIDEYRPGFQTVIGGMMDAIGKRSVSAPTADQVNLLSVLKMKKKITLEECERTAEAVKGNPIALSVLTDLAQDHGIMRNFNSLCPEMSTKTALEVVTGMRDGLEDWFQHDTTRASRLSKKFYEDRYGEYQGELSKRPLFSDKEGCYRDLAGLSPDDLQLFSEIVDVAEGGTE